MKAIILAAVAVTQAIHIKGDDIWAETVDDLNVNEYTKDNPDGYFQKDAPRPDPKVVAALVQKEKEKARK